MTKEQINEKAEEIYPIKLPAEIYMDRLISDYNKKQREGYIRALTEIEELPKIHGWVARDETGSQSFLFNEKPQRKERENIKYWGAEYGGYLMLPDGMFPGLSWSDEPIEVELIIRPL